MPTNVRSGEFSEEAWIQTQPKVTPIKTTLHNKNFSGWRKIVASFAGRDFSISTCTIVTWKLSTESGKRSEPAAIRDRKSSTATIAIELFAQNADLSNTHKPSQGPESYWTAWKIFLESSYFWPVSDFENSTKETSTNATSAGLNSHQGWDWNTTGMALKLAILFFQLTAWTVFKA